jgi:hypothetical protein
MAVIADYAGHRVHIYDIANLGSLGGGLITSGFPGEKIKCVRTGEFRAPRKGEWYLSGAIPEGYRAPNDLATDFHILKLVRVIPMTVYEIKDLSEDQKRRYVTTDQD